MIISQNIAIAAAAGAAIALSIQGIRLIKLGKPKEFSQKQGNVKKAVAYAYTTAMLPQHKESAMLHLPTYTLGMLFHIGMFASFLLFICSFFAFFATLLLHCQWLHVVLPLCLSVSTVCGMMLFCKRFFSKELQILSNVDDYLSNGLSTLFQLMTVLFLAIPTNSSIVNGYYIAAILLFLYMPLGKLRHLLYFFAARYHLGFFYGWRNSWPPDKPQNS